MSTDQRISTMIARCGLLEDAAIEAYDLAMFFKYHAIALYLIERRIKSFYKN